MLQHQSLGRLVAWMQSDHKGFIHMRYLLPDSVTTELFLAMPGSRIQVTGAQVESSISFAGQRVWMAATLGTRELDVRFEKLAERTPVELITWFEDGLEEYTGRRTLRQSPQRRSGGVLRIAA